MSKVSQAQQKNEALKRLEILGLDMSTIADFRERSMFQVSEIFCNPPTAKVLAHVIEFQNRFPDKLVYHVIHSYTNIGEMYTLFYVDADNDEWDLDREDMKENQALCYVINLDMPDCSEFGAIGYELNPQTKTLIRVW